MSSDFRSISPQLEKNVSLSFLTDVHMYVHTSAAVRSRKRNRPCVHDDEINVSLAVWDLQEDSHSHVTPDGFNMMRFAC